jgi:hypothetical protein
LESFAGLGTHSGVGITSLALPLIGTDDIWCVSVARLCQVDCFRCCFVFAGVFYLCSACGRGRRRAAAAAAAVAAAPQSLLLLLLLPLLSLL